MVFVNVLISYQIPYQPARGCQPGERGTNLSGIAGFSKINTDSLAEKGGFPRICEAYMKINLYL